MNPAHRQQKPNTKVILDTKSKGPRSDDVAKKFKNKKG